MLEALVCFIEELIDVFNFEGSVSKRIFVLKTRVRQPAAAGAARIRSTGSFPPMEWHANNKLM